MISIEVRREFLNKDVCVAEARRIISEGTIRNMSELQLAREIYFHALAFYICEKTGRMPRIKAHAHTIDLEDGGDTGFRRIVYAASWKLTRRK